MLDMIIIGFIAALICPLIIGLWPMLKDNNNIKYFDSEFLSDEENMVPADWNFTVPAHQMYTYEGHNVNICLCKACALDAPKKTSSKGRTPTIIIAPIKVLDFMPKNPIKPSFIKFANNPSGFDLSDVRMAA